MRSQGCANNAFHESPNELNRKNEFFRNVYSKGSLRKSAAPRTCASTSKHSILHCPSGLLLSEYTAKKLDSDGVRELIANSVNSLLPILDFNFCWSLHETLNREEPPREAKPVSAHQYHCETCSCRR